MNFVLKAQQVQASQGQLFQSQDVIKEKAQGKKWMDEKQKEDGVVTLPSGLMYKVLRKGTGKFHPKVSTPCECHYEGTLTNGDKFDSSYDRGQPTSFQPNQVIKGWTEQMQLMVEGDKWEMYIPSDLQYGDSGSPPKIPGGQTLVFKMEIISINGDKVKQVHCNQETLEDCDDKEKTYIEKIKKWEQEKVESEQKRLRKMFDENQKTRNLTKKKRVSLEMRLNLIEQYQKLGGKKQEL